MKTLPDSSPLETVSVRITGHVQGVGYRQATVRRGHLIGVRGWVRNHEDGSVQALVQGTPDQVDQMLAWFRQGPPGARVQDVVSQVEYIDRRFEKFEQN